MNSDHFLIFELRESGRKIDPATGVLLGRFHLIIPGNQKTEFRNPFLNSRPLLPFNQPGFDRIGGAVRTLPFNNSWKSENRVSKSKIEFPALASI